MRIINIMTKLFIIQKHTTIKMAFSKRYPKPTEGSVYPKWVEISLTEEEEKQAEAEAREENIKLYRDSLHDAGKIVTEENLKPYQSDVVSIASSLFEKRASHLVYHKEKKCKEKLNTSN